VLALGAAMSWSVGTARAASPDPTFTALPASGTSELQTARWGAVAAPLPTGDVLIAGGSPDGFTVEQSAERFNPSNNTFTALANIGGALNTAREGAVAAPLPNGKMLTASGFDGTNDLQSAEPFDPTTNTFTALPRPAIRSCRPAARTQSRFRWRPGRC